MLNAPPLSWLIAALVVVSIYSFFYLRRRRPSRPWLRNFLLRRRRRRSRSSTFQFHLFDGLPIHIGVPTPPTAAAGLDLASIAALPVETFAALKLLTNNRVPSDCAICLTPFEPDETLRFIPKCSHAFHVACLDPWLESHTTCPSCRAGLLCEANDVVIEVNSVVDNDEQGFTLGTSPKVLWAHFWKQKAPLRLKILLCRVLSGAFPIAFRRRCSICGVGDVGETSEHMFFRCPAARAIWYDFWGIRTDAADWTTANWVEAVLYPSRFLGFDVEEEGEMFLFLCCLMDKIWWTRNRLVDGFEDEVSLERLKLDVVDSFWELKSAFCLKQKNDHS